MSKRRLRRRPPVIVRLGPPDAADVTPPKAGAKALQVAHADRTRAVLRVRDCGTQGQR